MSGFFYEVKSKDDELTLIMERKNSTDFPKYVGHYKGDHDATEFFKYAYAFREAEDGKACGCVKDGYELGKLKESLDDRLQEMLDLGNDCPYICIKLSGGRKGYEDMSVKFPVDSPYIFYAMMNALETLIEANYEWETE